jgi:hypothetical protein
MPTKKVIVILTVVLVKWISLCGNTFYIISHDWFSFQLSNKIKHRVYLFLEVKW